MEFNPIKDFWQFINYPIRYDYQEKVPMPFLYVNVLFVMAFFINMLALVFVNSMIVDLSDIGSVFDEMDYGFLAMFALAVLAAPLAEELIFRYPLRNKNALTVLVASLLSMLVAIICVGQGLTELAYILAPGVFIFTLMFFVINKAAWAHWKVMIDEYYPYLFFLVAAMFAFIHIYNYNPSAFSWWMAPLIVIPQFVLALFLGFARLRLGLWASIYMHALNNTIPLVLFFLVKDLPVG